MQKAKQQKYGFSGILLGTLDAPLSTNILTDKAKTPGQGVIRSGEKSITPGQIF